MKREARSWLWGPTALWVSGVFLAYLLSLVALAISGFSRSILDVSFVLAFLVAFSGSLGGLNASRLFGGGGNFVGRLLLFFSASLLVSSLVWIVTVLTFETASNFFLDTSLLITLLFLAGVILAAYALVSSAWAVIDGFNRTIVKRIFVALLIVTVIESLSVEGSVLRGLTILGALQSDIPYDVVIFALLAGALVLISQLGKWYATPGIRMIAYGYVIFAVAPSLVRGLLLVSGIQYEVQVATFVTTITVSLYFVSLGMCRTKPSSTRPSD